MPLARFDHAYYRDQYFPLLNALTGDYQFLRKTPLPCSGEFVANSHTLIVG